MNDKNAAQAAEQDPLSDQFVNAVIRQHGYDSPEAVIARLWQWIGLNGSENGVTLLMYEAHKALSKLRAPVADELVTSLRSMASVAPASECEILLAAASALASAPADPEAAEVDFLVRMLEKMETWRAEEWSELLERRPAILALLRPMVQASAPVAEQAALSAQSATKDDKAALGIPECGKPLCAPGEHHPLCRHGWAEKKAASAPVAGEAPAEQLIQAAIDQAPEPLRRLGEYLSRVLDEDQWATAERMLLGACDAAPQASEAESKQRAGYAGVTVWVGDKQATNIVTKQLLEVSNADELLRRFEAALFALSAQPDAEPLSNPKQFALTAADERTAFEATYLADYDDPGAACEREHFGKGYRAGILATRHHDDSQEASEPEPKRFVILKESGSRFAYVNDTELGRTVKRFDVLKGDGWGKAERLATRLNAQHESAGLAAQSAKEQNDAN